MNDKELIAKAIERYEENRPFSHPNLQQCFVKDNVVVLRNITGTLARYPVDELVEEPIADEPIEKEQEDESTGE